MLDVREEPEVQSRVDDARLKWSRADDAWDAVTWTLARDPMGAGPALTESGMVRMMVYDGARSIGMPSIRAVYTVDPMRVVVREVMFHESPHLYAGNA